MLPNLKAGYCEMARSIEIVIQADSPPSNPNPTRLPTPRDTSGRHPSAALPADMPLQSDSPLAGATSPQAVSLSMPLADVSEQPQTAEKQLPANSATCEAGKLAVVRLEGGASECSDDGGSQSREAVAAATDAHAVAAEETVGSPLPVTEADQGVNDAAAQVNSGKMPLATTVLVAWLGSLAWQLQRVGYLRAPVLALSIRPWTSYKACTLSCADTCQLFMPAGFQDDYTASTSWPSKHGTPLHN